MFFLVLIEVGRCSSCCCCSDSRRVELSCDVLRARERARVTVSPLSFVSFSHQTKTLHNNTYYIVIKERNVQNTPCERRSKRSNARWHLRRRRRRRQLRWHSMRSSSSNTVWVSRVLSFGRTIIDPIFCANHQNRLRVSRRKNPPRRLRCNARP